MSLLHRRLSLRQLEELNKYKHNKMLEKQQKQTIIKETSETQNIIQLLLSKPAKPIVWPLIFKHFSQPGTETGRGIILSNHSGIHGG